MSKKIPQPNYTQIPNVLLDNIHVYTPAQWKVICVVARRTFGWHKRMDRISLSQIASASGLSRQGVINAVQQLLESGVLVRETNDHGAGYLYGFDIQLVNSVDQNTRSSKLSVPGVVNSVDHQLVNSVDPQKKDIKKRKKTTTDGRGSGSTPNGVNVERSMAGAGKSNRAEVRAELVGNVFRHYEDNVGLLTPIIADNLGDLVDEYGPGWVSEAIDIAVRAEKRSLRYVHGILRRWKSEGKGASRSRLAGPAQRIDEPDQIVDPFDIAKGES